MIEFLLKYFTLIHQVPLFIIYMKFYFFILKYKNTILKLYVSSKNIK